MLTERDKYILRFVEFHKSITINQCVKIFFHGNKYGYDQARKRLRKLNKEGFIKRYRQDPKSETIYYIEKRLKIHDLKLLDVIAELNELGIVGINKEHKISINSNLNYIIDATAVITYKNTKIPLIVEIDYTHYTSDKKIKDLINYLERKHKIGYLFIIVRSAAEKVEVKNIGELSKIVLVPWSFNRGDMVARSLRSLLDS